MRTRVAEDDFEVSGSTPSPRTFAPHKSRVNKLHQVSSVRVILLVFTTVTLNSAADYQTWVRNLVV